MSLYLHISNVEPRFNGRQILIARISGSEKAVKRDDLVYEAILR
jgi:hypothetical protein